MAPTPTQEQQHHQPELPEMEHASSGEHQSDLPIPLESMTPQPLPLADSFTTSTVITTTTRITPSLPTLQTSTQPTATATGDASPPPPPPPPPLPPPESDSETKSPLQITAPYSALTITVLLQSGAKHPFVLNQEFLGRHSVNTSAGKALTDPFDLTVLQFKECIWKDWREDWDQRPASALFIKLIQYGAYLNDSSPLRDCRFASGSSNVVHMAIRPAEVGDDDMTQRSSKAGAFGHTRDRETGGRRTSCRCIIL